MAEEYYKPRKTLMKKSDIEKLKNKKNTDSNKKNTSDKKDYSNFKKTESSEGVQKGGGKIGGYYKPKTVEYNPMRSIIWGLIVILIISAIFIVVFFTNALNTLKIGGTNLEKQDLEMKISQVQIQKDSLDLKMNINPKGQELAGVKIIVDDGTNFDIFKVELSQEEIEKGEIHLELDKVNGEKITKILVSPMFKNGDNMAIIGSVEDSYSPRKTDFVNKETDKKNPNTNQKQTNQVIQNTTQNKGCTDTCDNLGFECGNNSICGKQEDCGKCASGFFCNSSSLCEQEEICLDNCSNLNLQCGNHSICELDVNCGTCQQGYSCNSTGFCIEDIICTPEFAYLCNKGNVTWYDSCGDIGEIKETCESDEECIVNECVKKQEPPPYCGNGILEQGEYCEFNNLVGETCESFGYISGILRCNSKCAFTLIDCLPPETSQGCISMANSHCYNGDVWWYNSCDEREKMKQECQVECDESQGEANCLCYCSSNFDCNIGDVCKGCMCYTPEDECEPEASFTCYAGKSYWLDSCGERGEIKEDCSALGQVCQNGVCQEICADHNYVSCYGGDVYWYDSCDSRQERLYDCTSNQECVNGQCVNKEPVCTDHASSTCYDGDVYWYDSCDNRQTIRYDCTSNQECVNGQCVSSQITTITKAIVADHNAADDFDIIPMCWINEAKNKFRIAYEHTSHGSQIPSGLQGLERLLGNPYNIGTETGDLYFHDDAMASYASNAADLGYSGWSTATRNYLNSHSSTNVVMWSWCGQVGAHLNDMSSYLLQPAESIKSEYGVEFIYMTGHLDGTGPNGNVEKANNLIRQHVQDNNGVLFDFADIESYDPEDNYYPSGSDNCAWCTTWCNSHSSECSPILTQIYSCAHSHDYNCYRKAKAFWWLMARMAGWDGTANDACP